MFEYQHEKHFENLRCKSNDYIRGIAYGQAIKLFEYDRLKAQLYKSFERFHFTWKFDTWSENFSGLYRLRKKTSMTTSKPSHIQEAYFSSSHHVLQFFEVKLLLSIRNRLKT